MYIRKWDAHSAEVIVARALAVELASTEVDVRGAVAVLPRLRDEASRASIAGVESNRLEDREHLGDISGQRVVQKAQADTQIV
jgi:hypothetical protein